MSSEETPFHSEKSDLEERRLVIRTLELALLGHLEELRLYRADPPRDRRVWLEWFARMQSDLLALQAAVTELLRRYTDSA